MTTDVLLRPLPEVYDVAAAHVARHGLHKGAFKHYGQHPGGDWDCPLCALGALLVAGFGRVDCFAWETLTQPVLKQLRNAGRPFEAVQLWSDHADTTAEMVVDTFRAVAAKLRGSAGA